MKSWMKQHIRRNLPELMENIRWTNEIKAAIQVSILSFSDIESIEVRPEAYSRSMKLLEILMTRRDHAYIEFMRILRRTGQDAAFDILELGLKTHEADTWTEYIKDNALRDSTPMPARAPISTEDRPSCIKLSLFGIEVDNIPIPSSLKLPIAVVLLASAVVYCVYCNTK